MADCCDLCKRQVEKGKVCDTAVLWHNAGETRGFRCGLKAFADKKNISHNPGRTSVQSHIV